MDKRRNRPEFAIETEQPMAGNSLPDNLALDAMAAQALGYGCHYGAYKADHPHTYAEREAAGVFDKPKRRQKGYDRICAYCGRYFVGKVRTAKYCSDICKSAANGAAARARHKAKKEEQSNG